MTTSLKINLRELNAAFIQRLKEQYASDVLVEINIAGAVASPMNEDEFWGIIDLLNWKANTDEDILEAALEALSNLEVGAIYRFQDFLSEKLYQLDQKQFAIQVGYSDSCYFSVDGFLYTRACVLANGRDTYDAVLNQEMEMPSNLSFEPILYLAAQAYQKKTGKTFVFIPRYAYETFSNREGWE